MLKRERFEREYKTLVDYRGYGMSVWSPLALGLLAGRYNDGNIPEGRVKYNMDLGDDYFDQYFSPEGKAETVRLLSGLGDIAKELGVSQPQLALAWVIVCQDANCTLMGFSKLSQVTDNLKTLELLQKWTPELEKRINDHLKTQPEMEKDWRTWEPEFSHRPF